MNICNECKSFKESNFNETKFHECKHADCRHPVSGRPQTCISMRKRNEPCGVQGILWTLGTRGQTVKVASVKPAKKAA